MTGIDWFCALVKISFQIVFAIVTAIPFWISWNCIAPKYLQQWVPPQFLGEIPYWHVVAMFLICTYIGEQINKLIPTIVKVNQSNSNKES